MGRLLKLSLLAVAFVVTTSPAWAGTQNCCWKVYLKGVDKCGCLTYCGGQCNVVYTCWNTCTGCYTAKCCSGCVENCSGCGPCVYKCCNFFCDPCYNICVKTSCYTVGKKGACTYTCCGSATAA